MEVVTLEDTCCCGAKFRITGEYVNTRHHRWLEAHEVCRAKQPNPLEETK